MSETPTRVPFVTNSRQRRKLTQGMTDEIRRALFALAGRMVAVDPHEKFIIAKAELLHQPALDGAVTRFWS